MGGETLTPPKVYTKYENKPLKIVVCSLQKPNSFRRQRTGPKPKYPRLRPGIQWYLLFIQVIWSCWSAQLTHWVDITHKQKPKFYLEMKVEVKYWTWISLHVLLWSIMRNMRFIVTSF
jgi:hypothetical protein